MEIPIENKSRSKKIKVRREESKLDSLPQPSEDYTVNKEELSSRDLAEKLSHLSPSEARKVWVAAKHLRRFAKILNIPEPEETTNSEEPWREE